MSDIEWNLEALRDDARAWNCVSGKLGQAASLLDQARLTHQDFMAFLPSAGSAEAGVSSAVAAMREFAARGQELTSQGSQVLVEVAEAYRANEEEAQQALDGMWEPEDR